MAFTAPEADRIARLVQHLILHPAFTLASAATADALAAELAGGAADTALSTWPYRRTMPADPFDN